MENKFKIYDTTSRHHVTFGLFTLLWVYSWVLAQGFWQTLATVVIPPYGWYVAVEKLASIFGLL